MMVEFVKLVGIRARNCDIQVNKALKTWTGVDPCLRTSEYKSANFVIFANLMNLTFMLSCANNEGYTFSSPKPYI